MPEAKKPARPSPQPRAAFTGPAALKRLNRSLDADLICDSRGSAGRWVAGVGTAGAGVGRPAAVVVRFRPSP